jgi:phosphoglycerate dehydrogenase-like enzyme
MFDAAAFARMRPTTMIVNTARGGLIDEPALLDALREGRIAGAALDVTRDEPLPDGHPLLDAPTVILTGHSGAASTAAGGELRRRSVDAALAGVRGEAPAALVDPAVVDRPNCRLRLP